MTQKEKAALFAKFHVKGDPVLLYNAWDAGSAKAIVEGGAKAIATSSWSVATAQGYQDGEDIPVELAQTLYARIAAAVDVPVTADFEGGYADDDDALAANVGLLLDNGIIGINFEDRVVKGAGLYDIVRQARRIAAVRKAADAKGIALFINARTDLFLGQGNDPAGTVDEALQRAEAYAAAGASGFFIPGLIEEALIGRISERATLPVNVMVMGGLPSNARLAELGIARISYGPIPYAEGLATLTQVAAKIFS